MIPEEFFDPLGTFLRTISVSVRATLDDRHAGLQAELVQPEVRDYVSDQVHRERGDNLIKFDVG